MTQKIRQTQRGISNSFCHSDVGIRTQKAFNSSGDLKTVLFDFSNGVPKFRRQRRTQSDEFEIYVLVVREVSQWPVKVAIVSSGCGNCSDPAFVGTQAEAPSRERRRYSLGSYSGTIERSASNIAKRSRRSTALARFVIKASNLSGCISVLFTFESRGSSVDSINSLEEARCSVILSPGRKPVNLIGIPWFTAEPASSIILRARSGIRILAVGSSEASTIKSTAFSSVRKYLVASACVTVTGPPASICWAKSL